MQTSLYTILCIVIRLAAVLLAAEVAVSLPGTLDTVLHSSEFQPGLQRWLLIFYGLFFAIAAGLWIYPGLLARLAAGESSRQAFESSLTGDEWQYIALSVLGIYLVLVGFSDLLGAGARIIVAAHVEGRGADELRDTEWARLVGLTIKVLLGFGLATGARGLVGWLRNLRERGLPPASESDEGTANRQAE